MAAGRYVRIAAVVLAAAATCAGLACNGGKGGDGSGGGRKAKFKIGFAMTLNHPYWNNFYSGAQDEGKKLGVEVIITDAQEDAGKQIMQVKQLIASGIDALCLVPMKPDELVAGVQEANRRKIPVILVNRHIGPGCEYVCYIGTDTYEGAVTSAKLLCGAIGGTGGIVEFHQELGSGPERLRSKAIRDVIEADFPDVKILRRIAHQGKRSVVVEEMKALLGDPRLSAQIRGVYAHGDEFALAAGQACQSRQRKDIAIVGMGGSKEAIAAIKAGLLTGTSYQQPEQEGRRGVRRAVELLQGRKLEKQYLIKCPPITKDNAEKYVGQF
jgi:ribose transport system substrate-binding protein